MTSEPDTSDPTAERAPQALAGRGRSGLFIGLSLAGVLAVVMGLTNPAIK